MDGIKENNFDRSLKKYWFWTLIPISIAFTILCFKGCKDPVIVNSDVGLKALDSLVIPKIDNIIRDLDSLKNKKKDTILIINKTIINNNKSINDKYEKAVRTIDTASYNTNIRIFNQYLKWYDGRKQD